MANIQTIFLVVAAGGRGSRLREVSRGVCKSLVNLAGKPLLYWALKRLPIDLISSVAIISTPDSLPSCIHIATELMPGISVLGVPQFTPIGTFDALQRGLSALRKKARNLNTKTPIAFMLGDNIPAPNCIRNELPFLKDADAVFYSRMTKDPGSSARIIRNKFGNPVTLIKDNGRPSVETEICGGLYLYSPCIWHKIENASPPIFINGEWNIDLLNIELFAKNKVKLINVDGQWLHINLPNDLCLAESILNTSLKSATHQFS